MRRILLALCICCMSVAPAAARMYQWQNPATGTTQLSGIPPGWYRSSEGGPRVYVFENNQLIDDTGIPVSAAQREALRAEAFGAAAEAAKGHLDTLAPSPAHAATSNLPTQAKLNAAPTAPAPAAATTSDKATALKALIDAWDQHQLDQARALLEMLPADGKTTPAPH